MVEAEASSPASHHVTQQVFAFDLEGDAPRLKIYIMPDAKVRQTSAPRAVLITAALEATGLGRPWSLVQDYLAGLDDARAGHVEALGWDAWCGPAAGARQKVYVRFRRAGLDDVLRHLDLGGRLAGPKMRDIQEAAREMWGVFLGRERGEGDEEAASESSDDDDDDSGIEVDGEGVKELLKFDNIDNLADRTAGALLAYEMRLGMDEPCSVKCKFCIRFHYCLKQIDQAHSQSWNAPTLARHW